MYELLKTKGNYSILPLMEEILHQLVGSLSNCLQGFIHARKNYLPTGAGFLPSTVRNQH